MNPLKRVILELCQNKYQFPAADVEFDHQPLQQNHSSEPKPLWHPGSIPLGFIAFVGHTFSVCLAGQVCFLSPRGKLGWLGIC